jgi:hypothetical protein
MPYRALMNGMMQEVDLVEQRIIVTPANGSKVSKWMLTSQSPDEEVTDDLADGSITRTVTLYRPSMEAGETQKIYDGESTYYLAVFGLGKWTVRMALYGRKAGGNSGMVKLDQISLSADFFYKGAPFPKYKNATMREVFQRL